MTPPAHSIVIIGAGLSGLAAAFRCLELARERGQSLQLTVLEAKPHAGGWVGTDKRDGFLVERGADGFLTEKRSVIELAKRLKLENRLIYPIPRDQGASVVYRNKLIPIPAGFSMMAPTQLAPILTTPMLSWRGKARLLGELFLPRGNPGEDESLGSFVERRFGSEALERLVQPLAGGIYGADPYRLSLRATMPRFLEEEALSRSVTLGLWRKARRQGRQRAARGARYHLFASFDQGMQTLIDALVASIPKESLQLGHPAQAITITPERVVVRTASREYYADHVVLATPAFAASRLLSPLDAQLSGLLSTIQHSSVVTVSFAFPSHALSHPLVGYGFVVPAREGRPLLAGTFSSQKWQFRAPLGTELLRLFFGGHTRSLNLSMKDDDFFLLARRELYDLLGITIEPLFGIVHRYENAMPHYEVNHLTRVAFAHKRLQMLGRVHLASNSLDGVGVPDAIAAGERAAQKAMR